MKDRIKQYVDGIFADAPKTPSTAELKEEILSNTLEKYEDLVASGKSEDAAYEAAVSGIGDISGLFEDSRERLFSQYTKEEIERDKKRSAAMIAVAVMLYILCVVPCIILETLGLNEDIGAVFMFIMIAAATGLLIYNSKTRIKYKKQDETVVEEFKEWKDKNSESKQIRNAVLAAWWLLVVAVYMIVSFATMAWYITWVIFLIGGAIENIIKIIFFSKR